MGSLSTVEEGFSQAGRISDSTAPSSPFSVRKEPQIHVVNGSSWLYRFLVHSRPSIKTNSGPHGLAKQVINDRAMDLEKGTGRK